MDEREKRCVSLARVVELGELSAAVEFLLANQRDARVRTKVRGICLSAREILFRSTLHELAATTHMFVTRALA